MKTPTRRKFVNASRAIISTRVDSVAVILALFVAISGVAALLRVRPDGFRAASLRRIAADATTRIDLNGAPPGDLRLLPGVGPATARSVVAFRRHLRPFHEVRDLSLLPGISENRLSVLRTYVEVEVPMSLNEAGRAVAASADVADLLRLSLTEDIGGGDITTILTVPADARAVASFHCREDAVVCGGPILEQCIRAAEAELELTMAVDEGTRAQAGAVIGSLKGSARDIVTMERLLLNVLQRLCGIATRTREYVDAAGNTGAVILETRKTVPGWRKLDKYAVLCGGASNHRMGLYDAVLVKENHFALAGGDFGATIAQVVAESPDGIHIQVEVETLEQLDIALRHGVDSVLLDNMTNEQMREAVSRAAALGKRPLLEASGGITLERIASVAATGVDRISVGALTHSVPAVDISLLVDL